MKRCRFISCLALTAYLFAAGLAAAHVHAPVSSANLCGVADHLGHNHSQNGHSQHGPAVPADAPGDHEADDDCLVCHFAGLATLSLSVDEFTLESQFSAAAVGWDFAPSPFDGYSFSRPRAPPCSYFA